MNKKRVYILAIIVFIIILIVSLIISANKNKKTTPTQPTISSPILQESQSLTRLAEDIHLKYPSLSSDGKKIFYYDNLKTNFYKLDLAQKQSQALSSFDFIKIEKVIWSPDDNSALIKTLNSVAPIEGRTPPLSDPNQPENAPLWWFYNFPGQKANPFILRGENNNYSPSDWSDDNTKLLLEKEKQNKPSLFVYDLKNKKMISTIKNSDNGIFSPDSKAILFSNFIDYDQKEIMVLKNGQQEKINLETSLEKMAWFDNENLIIAAYENDGEYIYSFNIFTKQKRILYKNKENITALNLMVSPDKKKLYFTAENVLYKLEIK